MELGGRLLGATRGGAERHGGEAVPQHDGQARRKAGGDRWRGDRWGGPEGSARRGGRRAPRRLAHMSAQMGVTAASPRPVDGSLPIF